MPKGVPTRLLEMSGITGGTQSGCGRGLDAAEQLGRSRSSGVGNRDVGRKTEEVSVLDLPYTTSSNVGEMTKPASGGSNDGGGQLGSMTSGGVMDEGVPQVGSIRWNPCPLLQAH